MPANRRTWTSCVCVPGYAGGAAVSSGLGSSVPNPGLPAKHDRGFIKVRFPAQTALGRFGDESITWAEIVAFDQRRGSEDMISKHSAGGFDVGFVQSPLQHARNRLSSIVLAETRSDGHAD